MSGSGARGCREGYGQANRVRLPDERELLEDDFLRDHCLEPTTASADGALGLRFRPVRAQLGEHRLRRTIWVDPDSYLIRRLELEHLDGTGPVTESGADYADVVVGGSRLRMPAWGRVDFRRTGASVTFTFRYQQFEEVRPR